MEEAGAMGKLWKDIYGHQSYVTLGSGVSTERAQYNISCQYPGKDITEITSVIHEDTTDDK